MSDPVEPINFPANPTIGLRYPFQGRNYVFYSPTTNPDDGYWRIMEPGTAGPCTSDQLNIDALTDEQRDQLNIEEDRIDDLYATPEALGLSNYLTYVPIETASVPSGPSTYFGLSNKDIPLKINTKEPGTAVGPGITDQTHAGGLNVVGATNFTDSTCEVSLQTRYASVTQNGVVGMAAGFNTFNSNGTMVNATSNRLVPSMSNLNDVFRIASNSSQQEHELSGVLGTMKNYVADHNLTGIMFNWGVISCNSTTNQEASFQTPFSGTPWVIFLQHRCPSPVQPVFQVVGRNANLFSWRSNGLNVSGSQLYFLAIGPTGKQNNSFPNGNPQ
jgi:hypothetical protein